MEKINKNVSLPPIGENPEIQSAKIYKKATSNRKRTKQKAKIAANIALIHEYDLKSKGVGNTSATQGELMREMVYQLIH